MAGNWSFPAREVRGSLNPQQSNSNNGNPASNRDACRIRDASITGENRRIAELCYRQYDAALPMARGSSNPPFIFSVQLRNEFFSLQSVMLPKRLSKGVMRIPTGGVMMTTQRNGFPVTRLLRESAWAYMRRFRARVLKLLRSPKRHCKSGAQKAGQAANPVEVFFVMHGTPARR